MAKRDVPNDNGKFHIKDKDNQDIVLEFVNPDDAKNHIVEELTGDDITAKLPSPRPTHNGKSINWFANFNVYNKKDNKKDGYANVDYTIAIPFTERTQYFVYYDKALHEITDELRTTRKAKLKAGDPPSGSIP